MAGRRALPDQHAAVRADHALELRGGAVTREVEQRLLVLDRPYARERARLGVAQPPLRERRLDARQRLEPPRDPHLLPRRARRDRTAPRQELRAALASPLRPSSATVEFG